MERFKSFGKNCIKIGVQSRMVWSGQQLPAGIQLFLVDNNGQMKSSFFGGQQLPAGIQLFLVDNNCQLESIVSWV